MEFQALTEGCIAAILSRTTPVDICRLSSVSKIFRSAAESDSVWARFLPSDSHFISSIVSQSPSLANAPSKKALYLALSDRPIIIDQGKQSFQLDRKSWKKCYMLAARALTIIWGGTEHYWNWTSMPESRHLEPFLSSPFCRSWFLNPRAVTTTIELCSLLVKNKLCLINALIEFDCMGSKQGCDFLDHELCLQGNYCTHHVP